MARTVTSLRIWGISGKTFTVSRCSGVVASKPVCSSTSIFPVVGGIRTQCPSMERCRYSAAIPTTPQLIRNCRRPHVHRFLFFSNRVCSGPRHWQSSQPHRGVGLRTQHLEPLIVQLSRHRVLWMMILEWYKMLKYFAHLFYVGSLLLSRLSCGVSILSGTHHSSSVGIFQMQIQQFT